VTTTFPSGNQSHTHTDTYVQFKDLHQEKWEVRKSYWWVIKYCIDILKSDIQLLCVLSWFVAFPEPIILVNLCCSVTLLHPQSCHNSVIAESVISTPLWIPHPLENKRPNIKYILRCNLDFFLLKTISIIHCCKSYCFFIIEDMLCNSIFYSPHSKLHFQLWKDIRECWENLQF
jgi:hypothetical protein